MLKLITVFPQEFIIIPLPGDEVLQPCHMTRQERHRLCSASGKGIRQAPRTAQKWKFNPFTCEILRPWIVDFRFCGSIILMAVSCWPSCKPASYLGSEPSHLAVCVYHTVHICLDIYACVHTCRYIEKVQIFAFMYIISVHALPSV